MRLPGSVLLVALAVVLSGCTGGSDPSTSDASTSKSTDADPATLLAALPGRVHSKATARFTMAFDSEGVGDVSIEGQLDAARGLLAMNLISTDESGKQEVIREIITPDTFYTSGTPFTPEGSWTATPVKELEKIGAGVGGGGAGQDPAQQLLLLTEFGGGLVEAGPATVRGVRTTKYTGVMNYERPSASAAGQKVAAVARMLSTIGAKRVPFELYLDGEGLPARVRSTVDNGRSDTLAFHYTTTTDYTDWGAPVTITIPTKTVPLGG